MRKSPVSSRKEIHLDPVAAELQWWALGGYALVMAEMRRRGASWTRTKTEKRVKYLITQQFEATKREPRWLGVGNPLWQPQTSQDYERLRYKIRVGESLDEAMI